MEFSIIVAMDKKNGIGKKGTLPWSLPGDMKHFKDITTEAPEGKENVVIMGRKTWESIPPKFRPLINRKNIILTHSLTSIYPKEVDVFSNFDDTLKWSLMKKEEGSVEEIYIIGGQQVFETALNHKDCKFLYITHIDKEFSCDTFFPSFNDNFTLLQCSDTKSEKGLNYQFCKYTRK